MSLNVFWLKEALTIVFNLKFFIHYTHLDPAEQNRPLPKFQQNQGSRAGFGMGQALGVPLPWGGGVTGSHGPWENSELVGHLTVENTEFVVAQKLFRSLVGPVL